MELFDFQKPHADFLYDRLKKANSALDGSITGAGKSFICLDVLIRLGLPYCIVSPKIMIENWKKLIEKHDAGRKCLFVTNYENIKTCKGEFFSERGWVLPVNTVICFDECHKLKGYKTMNSKLLTKLDLTKYKVYLLSATVADSPLAFCNVAKTLGFTNNEYVFLRTFGCKRGFQNKGWKFGGDLEHLERLHYLIFKNPRTRIGTRITLDDIRDFMPRQIISLFYIKDEYDKINTLYSMLDEDEEAQVSDREVDNELSASIIETVYGNLLEDKKINNKVFELELKRMKDHLVKRTRLRQLIELIKAKLVVDIIEQYHVDGFSVVVMFNYSCAINLLSQLLTKKGLKSEIINGQTKNKGDIIDTFQSDRLRILILNIKACSVGISLHDMNGQHRRVSLISPSDNIYELQQAFGRIYRAGTKSNVVQNIITIEKSIEESVYFLYTQKLRNMSVILDG